MGKKKPPQSEETDPANGNLLPRINISVQPEMKKEWDDFAKKEGMTTAAMIRLAVQQYMKKEKLATPDSQQDVVNKMKQGIEAKLNEKIAEMQALFKQLPQMGQASEMEESKKDRLKTQVIGILEDHSSGVEPKVLSKYCGIPRIEMNDLIAEMQTLGIVQIEKGKIRLVK
jgi:metal-responsive CopG/Arc/MetJ family transcriptional regulator